jgi:hypothetical protein
VDRTWRLPEFDRMSTDLGVHVLALLSRALRRYEAAPPGAGGPNPFCVAMAGGAPPPPLPDQAWAFLFGDAVSFHNLLLPGARSTDADAAALIRRGTFFVQRPRPRPCPHRPPLPPAGCISTGAACRLVQWAMWDNVSQQGDTVAALLSHAQLQCSNEELARELEWLPQAMAVADSLAGARME